ncbi:MAG: diacylglycerol kinase family lipid kinase [Lachnospiraceae bacterium]|nr:diacylglycerol kinase family lipid kinase [Lachnospiraceae bacterium]
MNVLLIYNPAAGQGRIKAQLSDIVDILIKADCRVEIYSTQSKQDATRKVEEDADRFDRIIASGGDGTLDEVVTGLMRSACEIPVGYLPAGSANDFASSIGIPHDLIAAARMAVADNLFSCDIGRFNEDFFIYVAAFGLFTEASYATSQELKNAIGYLAYIFEGARELVNISAYELEMDCDGEQVAGEFVLGMVTNATHIGGVEGLIPQKVALDDGYLEITMIAMPKNPIELTEILGYFANINRETKMVFATQAKRIHIRFKKSVPWTLDGEYGGEYEEVLIQNQPQALRIAV